MKKLNSPRNGFSNSGGVIAWILALIVIFGIVAGFKISTLYFDNAALKSEVEEISEQYLLEEGYDFIGNIIAAAGQYEIKLKGKDIKYAINNNRSQIEVNFSYKRSVDLYFHTIPYTLEIEVTKEIAKARNIINNFQSDIEAGSRGSSQRYLDDVKKKLNQ